MTYGDLKWKFLGRPIKPFAFATTLAMFWLCYVNVRHIGIFGATLLSDIMAILAAITGTALAAAWITCSQPMAEAGLLLAAGVWITRTTFALLTVPTNGDVYGWGFSLCWAIAAGGAYLLERTDPTRRWAIR